MFDVSTYILNPKGAVIPSLPVYHAGGGNGNGALNTIEASFCDDNIEPPSPETPPLNPRNPRTPASPKSKPSVLRGMAGMWFWILDTSLLLGSC